MDAIEGKAGQVVHRDPLMERAAAAGFQLVTTESDCGQVVWEWRRGLGPRPQFVSERVARYWMFKWLEQGPRRSDGVILTRQV